MGSTKKLTLAALLAALAAVLLVFGSLIEVVDLTAAALASFLVAFAFLELGTGYAILLWAVASLSSLLLLPSGASLFFAAFGLYPVCKAFLEKLPRTLEWALKVLTAAFVLATYILVGKFVLFLPDEALSGWLLWVFIPLALVTFVLYDIALSRLITFYTLRVRPRIARLLK